MNSVNPPHPLNITIDTVYQAYHDGIVSRLIDELKYPDHEPVDRPSIVDTFMNMAFNASKRSPDAQTKHGCVITKDGKVLSTGYNGFPRKIDYSRLPNTRPFKYPWMRHAERNALAWCETRPVGATAYVTGQCCNECLMTLWQHGIETVYEANRHGTALTSKEDQKIRELFLVLSDMKVIKVNVKHLLEKSN